MRLPCVKSKELVYLEQDTWEEETLENIELLFLLTNFEFGEVYKGLFKKKINVTVKIFNGRTEDHEHFLYRESLIANETETLKRLNHENIVKLWCVCTVNEPKLIVTEYMSNGTLLNYIKMGVGAKFNINQIVNVAWQIAEGLTYLEQKRCVHMDLGARNVFVGENNIFKSEFQIIALKNT